ncbi:hypothetical protein [Halopiger thermotolerans]
MSIRIDERATDFEEIDRYDHGVGWIAHPDEQMQRASHAIEVDGDVWVIDPVDAEGIDDLLAEFGDVAGVVVLLERHTRDAAAVANRHKVPVYLHDSFSGVTGELEAAVARFGDELSDTGIEAHPIVGSRFWQEVVLFDPRDDTLIVPESVGTADFFRAGGERLGVHPMRRLVPPREALGEFDPERVVVGHGAGVLSNADVALEDALENSRRRAPGVYAKTVRQFLPV